LILQPARLCGRLQKKTRPGFALWNNNPKDIIQYNDSLLVVASGALNLVNTNNYRVQHISNSNGLPTNTVQSMAKDTSGMLWLGTMNGLCVADLKKSSFTVYNQSDGLLNDNFNVAGAHSLYDGRLLFMSAESFLIFDPRLTRNIQKNRIYITDFRVLNRSLPLDSLLALKQIDLRHNKTYLTIEFSALNYNKLNKLDYYYQLENLDSTWIKSDDGHQAVYTFLPAGHYTFKLKTRSVEGVWSAETVHLRLRVLPPFYKTWWFFVLLSVLVGTVLYLLYHERIKRLMTLHNIRSDIASHLHKDVSLTLNNINVLSQIARMKADRDIDRSKELIDEISGKSYNMMVSMDEILWSIDPSNDTMEKTLLRMKEFAKTIEVTYGATIDLMVHEKVKNLRLDMKVRHDFFIVCKAALQQVAQYAGGSNIMVDIDLVWSKIVVKMLSTGSDTENNTGLTELKKNLEEKAAAMHANLLFEIGKRDVSVILSIPVKPHSVVPYTIFGTRK
jgi:signal transduction histidine kinase